jgi:hypothetical protein
VNKSRLKSRLDLRAEAPDYRMALPAQNAYL